MARFALDWQTSAHDGVRYGVFPRVRIDKYRELAPGAKLRKVATPFLEDEDPDSVPTGTVEGGESSTLVRGELQPHAASILMKVLYVARTCR